MKRESLVPDHPDLLQPLMDFPKVLKIMRARYPELRLDHHQIRYLDHLAVAKFVSRLMSAIYGPDWDKIHERETRAHLRRKREQCHGYAVNARDYKRDWVRRKRAKACSVVSENF